MNNTTPQSEEDFKQKLTPQQYRVLREKGTEAPFSGKLISPNADGYYTCAGCGNPLFNAHAKFDSGTGWPSFDEALPGAVINIEDNSHGMHRTETVCAVCHSHLGHVFDDGPTSTGKRYCMNSVCFGDEHPAVSLSSHMNKKIVLAGGCFWGLEDLIRSQPGVVTTEVGYTGGTNINPTYDNHPGHAEAVEIEYDPTRTSYTALLDFFFQIHNPTTLNQQGNDIGTSYRSAIFYGNEEEKKEAEALITIVNQSKRWKDPVVTTCEPLGMFYKAENEHQDYLQKHKGGYTCHAHYFDSYVK
jgi:peptide methionine sulfoxide reductase msrA/msrB